MSRYYLAQLSIEGFRGINNDGDPLIIKFKPNAVNSIHAHNGVGKTSIFEAIHFAIFGTVPRLTRLQGAEHPEAYVVNRFHPSGEAAVGLWFEADDGSGTVAITVKRDAAGNRTVTSASAHADPEGFLRNLREDFVLVDYTKFASFIDASALERGRSFASLVGLSKYSQLRQALEGASDTRSLNTDLNLRALQTEVTAREREVAEAAARALAAYTEITGQQAADLSNIEGLCATVTGALRALPILKPVVGENDVRKVDVVAAEKLIEKEEGGALRARHAEILKAKGDLSALAGTEAEAAERSTIMRLAAERDTVMAKAGSPLLRELYERANAVIGSEMWPDPKQCPVCDSKVPIKLTDHLQQRIAQYAAADEANAQLQVAVESAASISRLGGLEMAQAMAVPAAEKVHGPVVQAAGEHTLPTTDLQQAYARLDDLETRRTKEMERLETERLDIETKLPPSLVAVSRMLAAVKQFCDALSSHAKAAVTLAKTRQDLTLRQRWQAFIGNASDAFCVAEAKLVNERITKIQTGYQDLFGDLVRGGPNVKPTLERATGTENVDLKLSNFHGLSNINARAVLSESYRNAVAASIFLSAALRYNGTPRFVVLDDVTSSFDAGHQFSLMEAIRTKLQQPANADGLQFIILSHDSALEKYFDKQNGTADWSHQKLQGMPPMGRVMISAQEADRLKVQARNFLNAGQVDFGAPFVRQYLEYKLGHVISKLQIPVPPDYVTRGDNRTVSTYLTAIVDMIDLYQSAGQCVLLPQQLADIKNTHAPAVMANYVSHYETASGGPIGAYALLGVLQTIDTLADCFTYMDTTPTPPVKRYYRRLDLK
jgi:DNA repair exonuclease SbcCD ATPase subunit